MKHYLTRVWVFLLVALTLLSACFPVWAEKRPKASTAETDWSAVQRLPVGSLLLIEQSDGIRVKGRLVAVADDALSVRRGKDVVETIIQWPAGESDDSVGYVAPAL